MKNHITPAKDWN